MAIVAIVCPRCGSDDVKLPALGMAPEGYVYDGRLLLLTCPACRVMRPMPEFVRTADDA